ncbi:MAG: hypothetical protein JSU07_03180 [Bacteroidetes bacterium]|nr:hypothetical protein [Bacteroidota bacterium]
MSFEDNFDKAVKHKIENAHFEFDESAWAAMSQKIAENSQVKSKKLYVLFGLFALTIASLGIFIFKGITNNTSTHILADKNTSKQTKNTIATANTFTNAKKKYQNSAIQIAKENNNKSQHNLSQSLITNVKNSSLTNAVTPANKANLTNKAIANKNLNIVNQLPEVMTSINNALNSENLFEREINESPIYLFKKRKGDPDYFVNRHRKHHFLNVEAGTAYLLGWNTLNGKDAAGLNYYAGLNYGFYLSKKLNLSFGVQAYNISNITQPFYTCQNINYSFGSTNNYTSITANQLLFISVPVNINYTYKNRHRFTAGINVATLLLEHNNVKTYTLNDADQRVVSNTYNNGNYNGISNKNIMLNVGYGFQLNKRMMLTAAFNFGLTDMYSNIQYTNFERVSGARLGLSYTLFDK